jgi:hypothetical protein
MPTAKFKTLLLCCAAIALGACAEKTLYDAEQFSTDTKDKHIFEASPHALLRAFRNAVLQNQYVIQEEEDSNKNRIKALKVNPLDDNQYAGLSIEASAGHLSDTNSILRIVAHESQYEVTKNTETTEIGAFVFTIPLPTGQKQTVTETRKETVKKKDFYEKLYAAVTKELPEAKLEVKFEQADQYRTEQDKARMQERAKLEAQLEIQQVAPENSPLTTDKSTAPQALPKPALMPPKQVDRKPSINDF